MGTLKEASFVINGTNIDEYYYYPYPDVPQHCREGFVARVGNSTNKSIDIELEINDSTMRELNFTSCCFMFNTEEYTKSSIVMTSSYYSEYLKNPECVFAIWHEVGHFHTYRYFEETHDEKGSTKAKRIEYYNNGEIMPEEKVADLFALYYTSKETAVKYLKYMIKRRRERVIESEDNKFIAVKELCMRRRFIENFPSDEERIRAAIAELCGKTHFYEV